MTHTADPPNRTAAVRRAVGAVLIAALVGVGTGTLGAAAYYSDPIRPLAHTVGLWLIACIAVAFAEPVRQAMIRCTALLAAAVVAFYVGLPVFYRVKYPDVPAISPNPEQIALWLGFAVVAGTGLGYLLHLAGRERWWGAAGTAGAAGLLISDAAVRLVDHPSEFGVVGLLTLTGCGLVVGLTVARLDAPRGRLGRAAVLVVPVVVLGVAVVSIPDVVEQVLVGW